MFALPWHRTRRPAPARCPRPTANCHRRTGFTFAEILFAVMIMGIGFIMVAAILPVAIQQSQANLEESAAVAMVKRGVTVMEQSGFTFNELRDGTSIPVTPPPLDRATQPFVWPFFYYKYTDNYTAPTYSPVNRSLLNKIKGEFIDKSDPRFAWVPVGYKLGPLMVDHRGNLKSRYYEVFLIAVAARNRAAYGPEDLDPLADTFTPRTVHFYIQLEPGMPDRLVFTDDTAAKMAKEEPCAAEGAYVFVQDDRSTGAATGRFFRLGNKVEDKVGTWELLPSKDSIFDPGRNGLPIGSTSTSTTPPYLMPARGFMIGRDRAGRAITNPFEGSAQDLFAVRATIFFPTE